MKSHIYYLFPLAFSPFPTTHAAGHIPLPKGGVLMTGKVGADVTLEQGQEAARIIAINLTAAAYERTFFLPKRGSWTCEVPRNILASLVCREVQADPSLTQPLPGLNQNLLSSGCLV